MNEMVGKRRPFLILGKQAYGNFMPGTLGLPPPEPPGLGGLMGPMTGTAVGKIFSAEVGGADVG